MKKSTMHSTDNPVPGRSSKTTKLNNEGEKLWKSLEKK